ICCARNELPVLQTVAESLRDVFELDALDADKWFVGANGVANVEILIGGENLVAEFDERRVLFFAKTKLPLSVRKAALQLFVVGLGLLGVSRRLRVGVLVLGYFHFECTRACCTLSGMGELRLRRGKLRLQRVALLLRSSLRRLQRSLLVLFLVELVERRAQLVAQPVLKRLRTDRNSGNQGKQRERKEQLPHDQNTALRSSCMTSMASGGP